MSRNEPLVYNEAGRKRLLRRAFDVMNQRANAERPPRLKRWPLRGGKRTRYDGGPFLPVPMRTEVGRQRQTSALARFLLGFQARVYRTGSGRTDLNPAAQGVWHPSQTRMRQPIVSDLVNVDTLFGGRRSGRHRGHSPGRARDWNPAVWHWLSFADSTRPKGQQFLGCCVVQAYGMATAVQRAHELRINPGGGVLGVAIEERLLHNFPEEARNRLMDRETAERLTGPADIVEGPG